MKRKGWVEKDEGTTESSTSVGGKVVCACVCVCMCVCVCALECMSICEHVYVNTCVRV